MRLLARFPAFAYLQDISPTGRALIVLANGAQWGVMGLLPGDTKERDLSWLDLSAAAGLSADGGVMVGTESGEGIKQRRAVYMRRTDGQSPPVRLGDGFALAVSPDAKWVLSQPQDATRKLVVMPTGAGESKTFADGDMEYAQFASWAANRARILVTARQRRKPWRSFVLGLDGHATPATPEGVVAGAISPDGERVAALDPGGRVLLYRVGTRDPDIAPGPTETGDIASWSSDGRNLLVWTADGLTVHVFRRDLVSGKRSLVRDFSPGDPAGMIFVSPVIAADGRTCVYNFGRLLSNLYVVDGLK